MIRKLFVNIKDIFQEFYKLKKLVRTNIISPKLLVFMFYFIISTSASSQKFTLIQEKQIDSLNTIINNKSADTALANAYYELSCLLYYSDYDTVLYLCNKSINIIEQNLKNNPNEKVKKSLLKISSGAYGNLGSYYLNKDDNKALKYFNKSLKISKKVNNKEGIATALNNMGIIYHNIGDIPKALEYFNKSLRIQEEIGDLYGVSWTLNNIGYIYENQYDVDKAKEYYNKALKNSENLNDRAGIVYSLNNIGYVYEKENKLIKALEYYNNALKINNNLEDKSQISSSYLNIADIYKKQGNISKAKEYYNNALKISKELQDKKSMSMLLYRLSIISFKYGKINNALKYAKNSFTLAKENGSPNDISNAAEILSKVYEKQNNNKKALEMYKLFILMRDSITNEKNTKLVIKQHVKYEYDKKVIVDSIANAKQIKIKNLKIEKIEGEKKAQKQQRNILLLGFILILIFVVFIIRSYIQKKKANKFLILQKQEIAEKNEELNQQNEEITVQRDEIIKQKEIVETIHFEISESIDYATRLQQAILPEKKILEKYLSEHFILFNPKDKVSGDFYWWAHVENHTIITAADCTGHGVPGAFMSMLGTSFLREIVQKEYITHTGVILRKLRKEIIKALKQKGEMGEQKDGMDMAIISIDHETNIVQFSGANNPLYIIKSGTLKVKSEENNTIKLYELDELSTFKLYEIKPNKMPIAIYLKMDKFTTHEIQLEKGDQLYMFSDGFADQFGGPKGKKFKYKPFKRLLLENADKPMTEQKEILNNAFIDWKGNYEQIDDVVVIGLKI